MLILLLYFYLISKVLNTKALFSIIKISLNLSKVITMMFFLQFENFSKIKVDRQCLFQKYFKNFFNI